jgi:hypothetical protein
MDELVVSSNGQLHCNTKGFDGHDRNRSNSGANRDVDERILFAIDWRNPVDHQSREDRNCDTVEKEPWSSQRLSDRHRSSLHTWLNRISQNLIDCLHLLVWRRMENDDDRSQQAQRTAQFS